MGDCDDMRSDCEFEKVKVGGVHFRACSPRGAASELLRLAEQEQGCHVHLANAYSVALADRDRSYQCILNSGLTFPDGKPITWRVWAPGSRMQLEQVRGPQLFLDVLDQSQQTNLSHFLLGSTPETLEKLILTIDHQYPRAKIAGSLSPPFRPWTEQETDSIVAAVVGSGAALLWVALGTPKQDIIAARLARQSHLTVVAVGAAFDFAAGNLAMAPGCVRRLGLEWAYRLVQEPRRLWRRYVLGNPRFLISATKGLLDERRNS